MYEITFGPNGITLPPGTAASRAAERAKSKPETALSGAAMSAIASAAQEPTRRACARLARNEPYGHREQSVRSSGIIIGATGMDAIVQNIRMIVTTLAYSTPLDRAFASTGSFIDAPSPYAVARKVAELTEAIEAKEPRVRVTSITYSPTVGDEVQGRVYPKIHFELRQGVTL